MKINKNRYLQAGRMTALLTCLLFFSCDNDDFLNNAADDLTGQYSDHICFDISSDKQAQTKGFTEDKYPDQHFVLRGSGTPDTLCVRTIITDDIQTSMPTDKFITRGTPITGENFYDAFHVLAIKDNGSDFFMNVDVKQNGTVWSSDQTYYWPGSGTLQFHAWAPIDAKFISTPQSPENLIINYTVPGDDVSAQKDIIVASKSCDGDYNSSVPLNFQHICTAVRFVIGDQMQAGTIKSVALKSIKNSGTYNIANETWTLNDNIDDFTQELNKATSSSETSGSEITTDNGTFMMLPQTLPEGAMVEVKFQDGTTNTERILSASIANTEWPQGKTVTYKISITPEYEFKLDEENPVLDAHYVIYKTNLIVSGVPTGQSWTISATDNVTIQAQSDMNSWSQQGYWTDRYLESSGTDAGTARGQATYSGTGSGEFPIAIFIPENVNEATRELHLDVKIADNNEVVQTIIISQLSPSWFNEDLGCERIEEGTYPWGFYWNEDFSISYNLTNCEDGPRRNISTYVRWTKVLHTLTNLPWIGGFLKLIFGDDIPDLSFVEMETSGGILGLNKADEVTINLGQLNTGNLAVNPDNGQQNTQDIYNFEGIQLVNEIINMISSIPGVEVSTTGEGIFPNENASIACMKLNSWNIISINDNTMLKLTNDNNTADWYLPAKNEITKIKDADHPLEGEYWTSTAVENDNQHAWKFIFTFQSTNEELRNKELNVRAIRKKPN